MVFSSLTFICVFLPAVYLLHTAIPSRLARNIILIVASLVFYSYGEPVYVLLLLGSWIFNYALALFIDRKRKNATGKVLLVICVVVNIGLLVVFKYTGFILTNVNAITGLDIPIPAITMPIGISFYTFQTLSYVVDVYRDNVNVQKNPFWLLLYISFFPQLIAGPIVKYRDIADAINDRKISLAETVTGLRRFIFGVGKKVLIADTVAAVADDIFVAGVGQVNILVAWLGAICYALQIYYDFSGYSDMAIGMGRMFGFRFKENFNYPYMAVGIKDFWKRWHISLTDWFREYVYIPLGGNRKGKARTSLNKVTVFLLTGLWHGANWTFVLWGLFHAAFQLLEDYVPKIRKLPKAVLHIYALIVVITGFVIFRADTVTMAGTMIGQMFGGWFFNAASQTFLVGFLNPWFIVILISAVLGMGIIQWIVRKYEVLLAGRQYICRVVSMILAVAVLAMCILQLAGNTYHPFIYFRF